MNVLVLDARGQRQDRAPVDAKLRTGDRVVRSAHPRSGLYEELVAMDYGDPASAALVREALRYRAEHPGCRVSVVRVLDRHWTDTECRARVAGSLRADGDGGRTVRCADLPEILSPEPRMNLRIEQDAVLFEYAA